MPEPENESVTLPEAFTHLAVSLLGWVAYGAALYAVSRVVLNPDAPRTLVMHVSRVGERVAMRNATAWADTAAAFHRLYDNARAGVTA